MDALLIHRCTVYRGVRGDDRFGFETEVTWEQVATSVICRADFTFKFTSRVMITQEEFAGRNSGMLFTKPNANIQEQDIIVFTNIPELSGKQWRVEYIDPAFDGEGTHHMEMTIAEQENAEVLV